MSSSILDQLEAKPVPKKQQRIQIFVPQEGQVAIKAQIVDLRDKGYDRSALKKRLKSSGILIGLAKDSPDQVPTKRPAPTTPASRRCHPRRSSARRCLLFPCAGNSCPCK